MAEAHSAVAFSFSVTPDGFDVNLNHEAFKAVWQSGVRSWKKRYARMRVRLSHHTSVSLVKHGLVMNMAEWCQIMEEAIRSHAGKTQNIDVAHRHINSP